MLGRQVSIERHSLSNLENVILNMWEKLKFRTFSTKISCIRSNCLIKFYHGTNFFLFLLWNSLIIYLMWVMRRGFTKMGNTPKYYSKTTLTPMEIIKGGTHLISFDCLFTCVVCCACICSYPWDETHIQI